MQTLAYGSWPSPIDASLAAAHDGYPDSVGFVGDEAWWTEPRPTEGGRRTLVRRTAHGTGRLAVRGGSADGWTTAMSLTTTDVYACGTILYPLLDLTTWGSGETHDFESQYLQSLVGPFAEVPARYAERSPTEHADRITEPFPLFQGLDDVICPPVQCERFLARMDGRRVPHAYIAFEGEGHGFRRAETMVRALEAELSLSAQVFGLNPPGIPTLELAK